MFGCVLAVCLFACSEDVTLEVNTEDKTGYESLTDEEEHAYAGCVPVAISQILSFHKYPVKFGNTIVNWLEITRYPSVDLLREHGYLARINYAVPRFEMENDITLNGAFAGIGHEACLYG